MEPMKSTFWSLWLQPRGPNTKPELIECVDADDLEQPGTGIGELIRCFLPDGSGWTIKAATRNPPDPITTTITGLLYSVATYLEEVAERDCASPAYFLGRDCGTLAFASWSRAYVLEHTEIGTTTLMNLVKREEELVSQQSFELTAWPPAIGVRRPRIAKLDADPETDAINDVITCNSKQCANGCDPLTTCQHLLAVSSAAPASPGNVANVLYSLDEGDVWANTAAPAFAAGEDILAATCFRVGVDTWRLVTAREADPAAAMEISYTDDWGANWNLVVVGATVAQGVNGPKALFSWDERHIWMVTDDGYVYFSDDGALTWETQDAGDATTEDLNAVWFSNARTGMAVGENDAVIVTTDGRNWTTATATGGGNGLDCVGENAGGGIWWVGDDGGDFYYSSDGGTTWDQRAFSGDGVGGVRAVGFATRTVGFMIHNTAAPVGRFFVTIDGGWTWEEVDVPTNTGLNGMWVCGPNLVYLVGAAGFIARYSDRVI